MLHNKSILFVTTLSSFLTPFMGSALNVALPSMGTDLSMNTISLGWIVTTYLLAAAIFLLPFGKLADQNGRKKFFLAGIYLTVVSSLICGLSINSWMLIVSRFINGMGGALIYATAIAILTSSYDKSIRGKVLGINVASVYLGLSLGPTIGGFCTALWGWRSIFFLTAFLAAIIIPIATKRLPADKVTNNENAFDKSGSVIYGLSLAVIIYGFPQMPSLQGIILFVLGIFGMVLFGYIEGKSSAPLLDIKSFRHNQVFIFSNIAAFINYSATYALMFLLSLYLQHVKHLSPSDTGLILMAQPIMMTIISPIAGKLSDKIEPFIVSSLGMAVATVGIASLIFISSDTSILFLVLMLMLLGLGFALFSSPNTNAVMSSVSNTEYGMASATLGTMRLVGQTMSMGITLMIFAILMVKEAHGSANIEGLMSSIHFAFFIFAVLCFIGIFFSLKRGKQSKAI